MDALGRLKLQIANAKAMVKTFEKTREATEEYIGTVLSQAPDEDKAEVLIFKMKTQKIMNKAQKGDMSYMEELANLTKEMNEKFNKNK